MGICVVAVLAICAVGAPSAFALEGIGQPEFGRCIKLVKGESGGEYSDANCTTTETGGKYRWAPGAGLKPHFTVEGREVETAEAKKCLLWQEEIGKGHREHAEEQREKWGYTIAQCEKVVKAHACFEWLRHGVKLPVGDEWTEEECEGPAKEWEEDYLKETVVLETIYGNKVECEKVTAHGNYSSADTKEIEGVVATFTHCEATILGSAHACTSEGAAEGEIVTSTLVGKLGIIHYEPDPSKEQVGISLAPASGTTFAELTCDGLKVVVRGSVIHPVTKNTMLLEENEKYTEKKGKQTPEQFEGGPVDVLETSINGGAFIESGETLLTTIVNEEKMEVNTYV